MDIQEFSSIPVEFYNNSYEENTKDDLSNVSDSTSEENDVNFSLQKGQIFETFEEVEKYLMQYCEQKGFEYHKRRVEYDDDNIIPFIRKRTYECTKAAQY